MKFKIDKSKLQHELGRIQALAKKTAEPQLVIDTTLDGRLRIAATDLNTTSISVIDADIEDEGSLCVSSAKFFDIVRLMDEGELTIKLAANHWTEVTKGRARYKLPGASRDSFPELPPIKPTGLISIPSGDLKRLLHQTTFVVPNEESVRFTLQCVKLVVDEDKIKMAATDGKRLAFAEATLAEESLAEIDTMVPDETLPELLKLIGDFDGPVNMSLSDNHLYFKCGDRLLISRLLTGKYPDFRKMIPSGDLSTVEFNTAELTSCVRRIAVVATNKAVVFTFGNYEVELSATSVEQGFAQEVISITSNLEMKIAFDYRYLLDFLDRCNSEKVTFDLKAPDHQVLFEPVGQTNYQYVLMPRRIEGIQQ